LSNFYFLPSWFTKLLEAIFSHFAKIIWTTSYTVGVGLKSYPSSQQSTLLCSCHPQPLSPCLCPRRRSRGGLQTGGHGRGLTGAVPQDELPCAGYTHAAVRVRHHRSFPCSSVKKKSQDPIQSVFLTYPITSKVCAGTGRWGSHELRLQRASHGGRWQANSIRKRRRRSTPTMHAWLPMF
jgi:hypothetical protein